MDEWWFDSSPVGQIPRTMVGLNFISVAVRSKYFRKGIDLQIPGK